jgi:hypothetical protein
VEKRILNEKNFKKDIKKKYEITDKYKGVRSVIRGYRAIDDCEIEDE